MDREHKDGAKSEEAEHRARQNEEIVFMFGIVALFVVGLALLTCFAVLQSSPFGAGGLPGGF